MFVDNLIAYAKALQKNVGAVVIEQDKINPQKIDLKNAPGKTGALPIIVFTSILKLLKFTEEKIAFNKCIFVAITAMYSIFTN